MYPKIKLILLTILLVIGNLHAVNACTVPLFKYALDRWEPEYYRLTIITDRGFSKQQIENCEIILEKNYTNLFLLTNSFANIPKKIKQQLAKGDNAFIEFAPKLKADRILWHGKLTTKKLTALTTSLINKQIVSHLIKNESAVWLFIPAKQAAKQQLNAQKLQLLKTTLHQAKQNLKLPEAGRNLTIAFPIIEVNADILANSLLFDNLKILLPQDVALGDTPLTVPIIGRGRALFALFCDRFSEKSILDLSKYIIGACACEVKVMNPGIDLLFSANWDKEFDYYPLARSEVTPPLPDDKSTKSDEQQLAVPGNKPTNADKTVIKKRTEVTAVNNKINHNSLNATAGEEQATTINNSNKTLFSLSEIMLLLAAGIIIISVVVAKFLTKNRQNRK